MRCGLNSKMSCGVSITKEMMYYCHNEHHLYRGKLVPLAARADIIVTWPSSAPLPWLAEVKWTSGLLMKLLGVEMPPSNWLLTDGPEQFYSPVPIISLLWCLSSWHSDMTLQEIVLFTHLYWLCNQQRLTIFALNWLVTMRLSMLSLVICYVQVPKPSKCYRNAQLHCKQSHTGRQCSVDRDVFIPNC